jgi:hypothetical protein
MKILFIHNYYTQFLQHFYKQNKEIVSTLTFKEHKRKIYEELFTASNFYSHAIRSLGHQADDIIANDWVIQKKWAMEQGISITTYPPIALNNRIGQQIFLHSWMDKIVELQIKAYRPDIVYFLDIESFSHNLLKRLKLGKYMIISQKASPILSIENYKMADMVISALPSMVEFFQKKHIQSNYVPLAFDPMVLRVIPRQKKIYTCSFVGGCSKIHTLGNKLLTDLSEQEHIDIFGYGKEFLPRFSMAYKTHHGEVWGKDMYKVLMQSAITINRHVDIAGSYAANIRLFEATGTGTMLLTDKKKNLGELFVEGKEAVAYSDVNDLVDKIRYYSSHEKERLRVAKAGQRRTLKDHTYIERMRQFLKFL